MPYLRVACDSGFEVVEALQNRIVFAISGDLEAVVGVCKYLPDCLIVKLIDGQKLRVVQVFDFSTSQLLVFIVLVGDSLVVLFPRRLGHHNPVYSPIPRPDTLQHGRVFGIGPELVVYMMHGILRGNLKIVTIEVDRDVLGWVSLGKRR